MRRGAAAVTGVVASAVAVLATACSGGSTAPTPEVSTAPAVSVTPTPTPTPAGCPDGGYTVTSVEARGGGSGFQGGTGGNVLVTFTAGDFTLSSDGTVPLKVKYGPVDADVSVNGQITGTYSGDASALQLSATGSSGQVQVKGFGISRTVAMSDLASQLIGQSTTAVATCNPDGSAKLDLQQVSLVLARR